MLRLGFMRKNIVMAALLLVAFSAFADLFYWIPVKGSYNGYFNDLAHWTNTTTKAMAARIPNIDDHARPWMRDALEQTIVFPDGVYTNFSKFQPMLRPGGTVVVESLNGSFVHPRGIGTNGLAKAQLTPDYYNANNITWYSSYNPFQIVYSYDGNDRELDLLGYINNCAITNGAAGDWNAYKVQPNLEFRNFRITAQAQSPRDLKVTFERGWFDYLFPCGERWANSEQFPSLYFGHFAGNQNNTQNCFLDTTEFVVESNATVRAPVLSIQGNARQNKAFFHGGHHEFPTLLMPSRLNGHEIYEGRTVTDLILDQGARIDVTNALRLCSFSRTSNRVERLSLREGSWMRVSKIDGCHWGEQEYNVDNSTLVFGCNARGSQTIQSNAVKSVTFNVVNGSTLMLDHRGEAPGPNGTGFYFGSQTDDGDFKFFFNLIDSQIVYGPQSKFNLYSGRHLFQNSVLDCPTGSTFQHIGGKGSTPSLLTIDHSAVTNRNTLYTALTGDARITLKNGSVLAVGNLSCGGTANNGDNGGKLGTVENPIYSQVDIYDSTITQYEDHKGGLLLIGTAQNEAPGTAKGVVNLYSGKIDFNDGSTASLVSVGDLGPGELNVYGGEVSAFVIRVAQSPWKSVYDHSHEDESVFRMYGGKAYSTCSGNGRWVGMAVCGTGYSSDCHRHGRVILNGGELKTYTLFGGKGAQARGGTGWAAFEADGGTITTPAWTPYLIECFDEARVGSKGLTIDNGGFGNVDSPIQVQQAFWEDKPGENGRIVLTGAGATVVTGNLERVSNLVVAGGYGDLTKLSGDSATPTLNNLIVTNSASLILDSARTITLNGTATFGDFALCFREALVNGKTYSLFRMAQPLSAESLVKWQDAYVSRGMPDGCGCDFTQSLDGSGWYVLKMKVRTSPSLVIRLPQGVSNGYANVSYPVSDTLKIYVGDGAELTLAGKLSRGAVEKRDPGTLYLQNVNNFFGPGFSLIGGCVSVANFRAITVGKYATSEFMTRYGTLEITGPENGATYDRSIYMWPMSTNEIFVIKNEVDVTMPCPHAGGTTGCFAKRGKGRLTFEVEANKTTTLTGGYGCGRISNNTLSWGVANVDQARFLKNGLPDTYQRSGVAPFMVYEGELVFRGMGPGAVVAENGETIIGYSTATGVAQPGLVLDNVMLNANAWPHGWIEVGCAVNYDVDVRYARTGDFALNPYVVISNGAELVTRQFECGRFCCGEDFRSSVTVDDATLRVMNYFTVNRSSAGGAQAAYDFRNNANVYIGTIYLVNDATLEFDHAVLAKDESLAPTQIRPETLGQKYCTASFNFRNGSVCSLDTINPDTLDTALTHPITLTFDDSQWIPTTNLTQNLTIEWASPDQVALQTSGTGLILDVPAAARTWTFNQPLVGDGGFVKRGPGVVAFDLGALEYTGLTRLEGGAVSLENTGAIVEMTVAGTGTLHRATLGKIVLQEEYVNGGNRVRECPHFDNLVATSGFVDFGRKSSNPLPYLEVSDMVVGTYSGTAPDVSRWRVRGVGIENARGEFACVDGKILLRSIQNGYGTLIITR